MKEIAHVKLQEEYRSEEKTKNIGGLPLLLETTRIYTYSYTNFTQNKQKQYFQAKCQSLDIKEHRRYKYKDCSLKKPFPI